MLPAKSELSNVHDMPVSVKLEFVVLTIDALVICLTCNTLPAGISAEEKGATLSSAGVVIPVVPFNIIVIIYFP